MILSTRHTPSVTTDQMREVDCAMAEDYCIEPGAADDEHPHHADRT